MDMRALNAFIITAEELNFRRAAERLNMTQPPLSRLINQLEYELGSALFNRTTRKVELTGAGVHLFNEGKKIIDSMRDLELEVKQLSKIKKGEVTIGLNGPVFHSDMPHVISSFKEQFKDSSISLKELPVSKQISSLKSGDIDVLITISRLNDSSLVCREVQSQELGLWVNRHHPLSKKKKIRLSDLNNEPFIFHPKSENLGFQKDFQEFLRGHRVIIRPYYKKANESCANLVVVGKGHLLTSKRMVNSRNDAVFVPLEDFSAKMKIYAYWSTKNNSALVKTFIHFIQDAGHIPASGLDSHFCSHPLK
nr:LysR family transcriptional regulator [Bacteriovorax sp. HI3]